MTNIYVNRGGWIGAELKDIKKGERFTVSIDDTVKDDNPLGDDIYVATEDAKLDGTTWIVSIDKPRQPRWSSEYLSKLAVKGIAIQVKGATINSLDYTTITG